jgi:hypothetical protein
MLAWYFLWTFEVSCGSNEVDGGAADHDLGLSGHPSTGVCQPAAKLPAVSGGRARGVAQRRLLPPERGNCKSVFKRFARWSERGVWADLHRHVAADPDLQEVLLDSPGVRAHSCAAGANPTFSTGGGKRSGGRINWTMRSKGLPYQPMVLVLIKG